MAFSLECNLIALLSTLLNYLMSFLVLKFRVFSINSVSILNSIFSAVLIPQNKESVHYAMLQNEEL